MITRTIGAAVAAFVILLSTAGTAHADMVRLRDGGWLPKKLSEAMGNEQAPGDEILKRSGKGNMDLGYTTVKVGNESVSAGLVDEVFATNAFNNEFFRNGDLQGQAGAWLEAADSFAQAAEALKGSSKEISMWKRVLCLAEAGDTDKTFVATRELLEAFPQSFYSAKVRDMRARIFLGQRKRKQAQNELDLVIASPSMNARDYFEAKLAKTHFFHLLPAGDDVKKIAAARGEYERVTQEISSRSGGRTEAGVQRLKANVGVGRCLVYEGEFAKALTRLQAVVDDKMSLQDRGLLARAYTGMGDAAFAQVKKELKDGDVPKDELPRIMDALTTAALHYLRVSEFYVESAGDDRYPATIGLARVWATQFEVGGKKDCELGKRAKKTYYAAHRMLPRGEARRLLTREAKMFIEKHTAACP